MCAKPTVYLYMHNEKIVRKSTKTNKHGKYISKQVKKETPKLLKVSSCA